MPEQLTDQQIDLDAIEAFLDGPHGKGALVEAKIARRLVAEVRRLRDQVAAVTELCDEQEMAARMFELPTPEWITAVRSATAPDARSAAVVEGGAR